MKPATPTSDAPSDPSRGTPPDASAERADVARVLAAVGGRRGLVDGGLPALVFVAVNAVVGLVARSLGAQAQPVWWALCAATGTAAMLLVHRVLRGEPVRGTVGGLLGLAMAAVLALWTGQARDFFLPGLYVDAAYAAAFAGSAFIGRPLVGYLYVVLFRRLRDWRTRGRLRRLFTLATLGWSGVYLVRVAAQAYLYRRDATELLVVSKLLLGWPLTALAVAVTLAALRRATSGP